MYTGRGVQHPLMKTALRIILRYDINPQPMTPEMNAAIGSSLFLPPKVALTPSIPSTTATAHAPPCSQIEMEYSVSVRVSPSSGEVDHIETVPADGEEDAVMLREIIETHLRARRAGRRCPDSDWLHRMMLDRGCSCPCKTPHSRAVVAVEQPAAPGGDWHPANPSHNDDHPTCCICMTSVDPAGARRLPCSHAFHPECLARCLQHSALCPLCKVPVE